MLQQEHRQISHGKSMHHLTFPTNYKQTMNNLIKAKNNSTTLTPVSATIPDSSNRIQEQLQQTARTSVNYTDNTMVSTATVARPPTQSVGNYGGNNTSPSTMGVNLRVTGQCSQGGRKYMEDYFSVAYQQSENAKDLEYAFIGIYDGHGGAEAATFAKEHLMMQIINQKAFWSESDHDVLRAIREGYIATHYAMWRDQGT
uniref:Protein phosphatase 1D n=1 Tax=Bactrocera latifrons TaxID=174628 RepID=A0A0K8WKC9_BACLA